MPGAGKTPRVGRRRWVKPKTIYSPAQTELDLPDTNHTQITFDFGDDVPSRPLRTKPVSEDVEQGDLFGFMAESPEPTPQIEFDGMQKPVFEVQFSDGRTARFQHANTLLESLESQDIHIEYQCREGYCGSCRTRLLEGEVHYIEEPMAWIDDDEILPCCCIPKSPLHLQ
ncbi:class I ribonucleotide reductase maintenance protein YfaE [uncultured Thalassolituus sp.]|uniref:class I ribonucleotide reductase maintenance protein YfaE n=1 Tax=uncultured Thalassolituus sp. TaxID=285273 RepID=UPI0035A2F820